MHAVVNSPVNNRNPGNHLRSFENDSMENPIEKPVLLNLIYVSVLCGFKSPAIRSIAHVDQYARFSKISIFIVFSTISLQVGIVRVMSGKTIRTQEYESSTQGDAFVSVGERQYFYYFLHRIH